VALSTESSLRSSLAASTSSADSESESDGGDTTTASSFGGGSRRALAGAELRSRTHAEREVERLRTEVDGEALRGGRPSPKERGRGSPRGAGVAHPR